MLQKNNNCFYSLVLIAMGLSGAAALIYEVISSKFFSYFFGSDTYSVSTMLSAFLLGIALGSFLISRFINRIENKRRLFSIFQFLIGAYALAFIANLNRFPFLLTFFYGFSGSSLFLITLSKFLAGLLYLIFPTILLGACFPLASSLLFQQNQELGVSIGVLYSLDTFGSILGASVAGFILIPYIGLRLTSLVAAFLSFTSSFLILEKKLKNVIIFILACLVFLSLFFLFSKEISPTSYLMPSYSNKNSNFDKIILERSNREIVFERNTPYGIVSVTNRDDQEGNKSYLLTINGRGQCGSHSFSERIISHLALANFKESINVANIGLGCGMTLDAILEHLNVKKVDVIEINSVVAYVAKQYFARDNNYALEDKKTNVIIDDAFHFLLTTNKKYDAIIVDVEEPGVPHSSPIYTVEYFKIVSERLSDKGVFAIWTYYNDYEYLKTAYYSIKEAFPYVYLTTEFDNVPIFIGSKRELDLDIEGLKNNLNNYPIFENLNFNGFEKELIKKIENDNNYRLSTLDNPVLEFIDAGILESDLKFKEQWEKERISE